MTRQYLSFTRAVCVFKIGKECGRSEDSCCIKRMTNRVKFDEPAEAFAFVTNCYHFLYERNCLDFCTKGNIFENAQRHCIRYFNFINRTNDFTAQRFRELNLNSAYVKNVLRRSRRLSKFSMIFLV